ALPEGDPREQKARPSADAGHPPGHDRWVSQVRRPARSNSRSMLPRWSAHLGRGRCDLGGAHLSRPGLRTWPGRPHFLTVCAAPAGSRWRPKSWLGGLAGEAEPGADLGPGVAAGAPSVDGLGYGGVDVKVALAPSKTRPEGAPLTGLP